MRWIIIILLMNISVIHSQQNESRMLSIKLITSDTNNNLVHMVILEFPNSNGFTLSSFDGDANFQLCSNQIKDSIIRIRATAINHKQEDFTYTVYSDTTLYVKMINDTIAGYSKIKYQEYFDSKRSGIEECGTYDLMREREENKDYIHCDGRIRSFIQIEESGESWAGWRLKE